MEQYSESLMYQVKIALEHLWSGQVDKARQTLEHATGYRQANKDFEDNG